MAAHPQSLLFPGDLGAVDDFDLNEVTISQYKGSPFKQGQLYLSFSMTQLRRLRRISRREQADTAQIQRELRRAWDSVRDQRDEITAEQKERNLVNIWKTVSLYYDKRKFRKDAHNLAMRIVQTSDAIRRGTLSVQSTDSLPLPPENRSRGRVSGLAVPDEDIDQMSEDDMDASDSAGPSPASPLPLQELDSTPGGGDRPMENATPTPPTNMEEPSRHPLISINISDSIIALHSAISSPTMNLGGMNNRGAVITQAIDANAAQYAAAVTVPPNAAS